MCENIYKKEEKTKLRIGLGLEPGESRWLAWTPNSKDHVDWTPGWWRDMWSSGLGVQIGEGAGGLDSRSVMEFG